MLCLESGLSDLERGRAIQGMGVEVGGSETQNRCELAGTRTPTFIIEINIDQSIFQSILSMTLA